MVTDGLGHGPLAAEAAEAARAVFKSDPFGSSGSMISKAHTALAGGRGAALAAARISSRGPMTYAGVGNISGSVLVGGRSRGLFSHNGTAGVQMRKPQELTYEWSEQSILIMHSDGLGSRWTLDTYPGLINRHPAVIAAVLHRDFVRGRDDATVLVVRAAMTARSAP